jgi:hypothetical protein
VFLDLRDGGAAAPEELTDTHETLEVEEQVSDELALRDRLAQPALIRRNSRAPVIARSGCLPPTAAPMVPPGVSRYG